MTISALFSVASFLTLLLGLGWILAPGAMLSAWGIAASDALIYMSRRSAALFLGYAVILWRSRTSIQSDARQAIVGGTLVVSILMAVMSLYGVLSNTINPSGWLAFAVEVLLAIGFGYFLLFKRNVAA